MQPAGDKQVVRSEITWRCFSQQNRRCTWQCQWHYMATHLSESDTSCPESTGCLPRRHQVSLLLDLELFVKHIYGFCIYSPKVWWLRLGIIWF